MENCKKIGNNKHQNDIKNLNVNNIITNNPQESANTFNDYFLTVTVTGIGNIKKGNSGPRDNVNSPKYVINNFKSTFPRINWNFATTYEIVKIIKSLKTKNSCGCDEIPIKILKLNVPFIISPLTYICNKSLSSDVFPQRLKCTTIKPVYKKRDKLLTTNYRPISLLTSFSKIF